MGIAFSGAMAGYGLAPPCQWAITRFGWRAALAGYVVAGGRPDSAGLDRAAGAAARRRRAAGPRDASTSGPCARSVAARRRSGSCSWSSRCPRSSAASPPTQHALYLTERGFSADAASVAARRSAACSAASGRVLFGLMADRVGAPPAGFVSFGFTFLGLAVPPRAGGVAGARPGLRLRAVPVPPDGLPGHDRVGAGRAHRARRRATAWSSAARDRQQPRLRPRAPPVRSALRLDGLLRRDLRGPRSASSASPSPPWRCFCLIATGVTRVARPDG